MNIPIVDAFGQVVGWTGTPPTLKEGRLTHEAASALIGPDISSTNVELSAADHLTRAGAPDGWKGIWRCVAICPCGAGSPFGFEPEMSLQRR